jgi:hypothetical protein
MFLDDAKPKNSTVAKIEINPEHFTMLITSFMDLYKSANFHIILYNNNPNLVKQIAFSWFADLSQDLLYLNILTHTKKLKTAIAL